MNTFFGLVLISASAMAYGRASDSLEFATNLCAFFAMIVCQAFGIYLIKRPEVKKGIREDTVFVPIKGDKVSVSDDGHLWFARVFWSKLDDKTFITYGVADKRNDPLSKWRYCEPFEKHFPD